jgi:RNA polymerase I-specific transcription initiation factor RRN6
VLGDDATRFNKLEDGINPKPLLEIGTIIDYSIPSRPVNTPVIATSTGESGELLRLARIESSQWAWDDNEESHLELPIIDSVDPDEELIWGTDALPIAQLKFATNGSLVTSSTQWLLVQKQTCTMILQPEYYRVPRAVDQELPSQDLRTTSRITANHLVTISHNDTGGNAHSDMSLSPSSTGRPTQLCIMDECGYWTLWNILGMIRRGNVSIRCYLYKCGHIWEGSLNEIPSSPSYPAERHGIAFIPDLVVPDTPQEVDSNSNHEHTHNRPHYVVMWNPDRIKVSDTEATTTSQELESFSPGGGNYGRVIDVQTNPLSSSQAFVLTTQFVLWVNLLVSASETMVVPKPSIILACHHLATKNENLKMIAVQSSIRQGDDPSVIVYSSPDRLMSVHWFSRSANDTMPQWHRQVVSLLPMMQDPAHSQGFQTISFQRAKLTGSRTASKRLSEYRKRHVQFYQGLILGEDLSLRHCMCFTSHDASFEVELPTKRLKWTKADQQRRWARKRARMLRSLAEVTVIPDQLSQVDLEYLACQPKDADTSLSAIQQDRGTERTPNPTKFDFRHLVHALNEALKAPAGNSAGVPSVVIDGLLSVVRDGGLNGSLPLTTW